LRPSSRWRSSTRTGTKVVLIFAAMRGSENSSFCINRHGPHHSAVKS
jgi:hypothetical protein